MITLNNLLNYKNENVIFRFTKIYAVTEDEANDIFCETLKWLWLSQKVNYPFFIDDSISIIDEMWHNFILFTKDYNDFCNKYFGKYIHHQPSTKEDARVWKDNWDKQLKEFEKQLEEQYEIIYDTLGADTLEKWYRDYAEKYSSEKTKQLLK